MILKNNKTNFGRQASQPPRGIFWATVIGYTLIHSSYQSGTQLTGNGWSPHRSLLPQPSSPRIPPFLSISTPYQLTYNTCYGVASYQLSNIPAHINKNKISTFKTDVNVFFLHGPFRNTRLN